MSDLLKENVMVSEVLVDMINLSVSELKRFAETDPEAFHVRKDEIFRGALAWISLGVSDPQGVATAALKADGFKPKWEACA